MPALPPAASRACPATRSPALPPEPPALPDEPPVALPALPPDAFPVRPPAALGALPPEPALPPPGGSPSGVEGVQARARSDRANAGERNATCVLSDAAPGAPATFGPAPLPLRQQTRLPVPYRDRVCRSCRFVTLAGDITERAVRARGGAHGVPRGTWWSPEAYGPHRPDVLGISVFLRGSAACVTGDVVVGYGIENELGGRPELAASPGSRSRGAGN